MYKWKVKSHSSHVKCKVPVFVTYVWFECKCSSARCVSIDSKGWGLSLHWCELKPICFWLVDICVLICWDRKEKKSVWSDVKMPFHPPRLVPSCSTPNRWTPGSGPTWPAPPSSLSSSASSRSSLCRGESTLAEICPHYRLKFLSLKMRWQ